MNAVRIRRKLESETLHLPELKPLIGKNVEIIVQQVPMPAVIPARAIGRPPCRPCASWKTMISRRSTSPARDRGNRRSRS